MAADTDATTTTKSKRRWLRFSLRPLLLLTVLVSALFAWIGNILVRVHHQRDIVGKIQVLLRNRLPQSAIDFAHSEFYVADMLGDPLDPVEIASAKDWAKKLRLAEDGKLNDCEEFSSIEFKKLVIRRDQLPKVDLFKLDRLGIGVYVSARLKEAIEKSGITGLDIRPNKRLFAGG